MPRATFYRWRPVPVGGPAPPAGGAGPPTGERPRVHPRALSDEEQQAVLDVLHAPRFCDVSPAETYATLLDEGTYLASERTMYRLLAAAGETGERRHQRVHPAYAKPELLATGPNQVWTWEPHQIVGPGQVDLLLSLCAPGHL